MSRFAIFLLFIIQIYFGRSVDIPSAAPIPQQFYVTNTIQNLSCIVLQFTAMISVNLRNGSDKAQTFTSYIDSAHFKQNPARANGTCGVQGQSMNISWPVLNVSLSNGTLSFEAINVDNTTYKIYNLKLSIPLNTTFDNFSDSELVLMSSTSVTVPMKNYYSCKTTFKVDFTNKLSGSNAQISVSDLNLIAFRQPSATMFSGGKNSCPLDYVVNNIVPLVVGGVLAAMVVIVIITYLIGRRRHRGNYQSI